MWLGAKWGKSTPFFKTLRLFYSSEGDSSLSSRLSDKSLSLPLSDHSVCVCMLSLTLAVMDLSPANENDLHSDTFYSFFSVAVHACVCDSVPIRGREPSQWKWRVAWTFCQHVTFLFVCLKTQHFSVIVEVCCFPPPGYSCGWAESRDSETFKWGTPLSFHVDETVHENGGESSWDIGGAAVPWRTRTWHRVQATEAPERSMSHVCQLGSLMAINEEF